MLGKIFHKWTVINEATTDKPGKWYECLCECGNIRIKAGTELRAGRGKQCADCQYQIRFDPCKEIGKRYGKWTIIRFIDIHRKLMRYEAECDCGIRGIHVAADLRAGKSGQCTACHNRENAQNNIKHGRHKDSIYKIWHAILQRCNNIKSTAYKWYGARGIKVCNRWLKFENFLQDMGERPDGLQIDRINNNGNYEPNNCKWVTPKENSNNTRKSKKNRMGQLTL
jgi:hypothetical protein